LVILIAVSFLLVACGGAAPEPTEILPTDIPPTDVPPTEPPPPADTPEPTVDLGPPPTPDPVIFLDEFDGGVAEGWEWLNEDPERWSVTNEGWLTITAANPGMGASESEFATVNLLTRPAPDGDFVVTTRIKADPHENFKQGTLYLLGEPKDFVAILIGFCDLCLPDNDGFGIFMEAFKGDENMLEFPFIGRDPQQTDYYLRLVYSVESNTVTGYYASEPDNWQPAFTVNDAPAFDRVALGTGNLPGPDGSSYDLEAYYDYLEIARVETPVIVNPQMPPGSEPPTETPIPETTPLPEGILFRDDFEGYLQSGWEWFNEDPELWEFVEMGGSRGLQLTGAAGRTNYLLRPAPEGDFILTAHIIADPLENFHQANIGVYENFDNYIVLNVGFCDFCVEGGEGFYMETFIDNNPFDTAYRIPRDPELNDVYLRLVIDVEGSITSYYATPDDPENWIKLGAFGNYFEFYTVGIGALNAFGEENTETDIIAFYDWFEISQP
jgi:hypothetical protein